MAGERKGHAFNPTDRVHEAWLRLGIAPDSDPAAFPASDRSHFLGLTVRAHLTNPEDRIALFDAIEKLGEVDERLRRVVEYRYLVGLTEYETAAALEVTTRIIPCELPAAK